MVLPPSSRALVLAARLAALGSLGMPAALPTAVPLPAIVQDADVEDLPAPEALDSDEINPLGLCHPAGEADLDSRRDK